MTALGSRKYTPSTFSEQDKPIRVIPKHDGLAISATIPYEFLDAIASIAKFIRVDLPRSMETRQEQQEVKCQEKQRQANGARLRILQNQKIGRRYSRRLRKLGVTGAERLSAIAEMASEIAMSTESLKTLIRLHEKATKKRRKRMQLHIVERMNEAGEPTREIANRLNVSEVHARRLLKEANKQ